MEIKEVKERKDSMEFFERPFAASVVIHGVTWQPIPQASEEIQILRTDSPIKICGTALLTIASLVSLVAGQYLSLECTSLCGESQALTIGGIAGISGVALSQIASCFYHKLKGTSDS